MVDIRFTPAQPIDADNNVPLSTILQRNDAVRRQTMQTQDLADERDTADTVNTALQKNMSIDPTTGKIVVNRKGALQHAIDAKDPDAVQAIQDRFTKEDAAAQTQTDTAQDRAGKIEQAKLAAIAVVDPTLAPDEFKQAVHFQAEALRAAQIPVTPEEEAAVTPQSVMQARNAVRGVTGMDKRDAEQARMNQGRYKTVTLTSEEKNGAHTVKKQRAAIYDSQTGQVLDAATHQPINATGATATDANGAPVNIGGATAPAQPATAPIAGGRLNGVTPADMLTPDGKLDPAKFYTAVLPPFEGKWNPADNNGQPTMYGFNKAFNPDVNPDWDLQKDAVPRAIDRYWNKYGADKIDNPALAAAYADTSFISPGQAKSFLAQSGGDPQKFMDLRKAWEERLIAKGRLAPNGTRSRTAALGQLVAGLGGGGAPASAGGAPVASGGPAGALDSPALGPVSYVAPGVPKAPQVGKFNGKLTDDDDMMAHEIALGASMNDLGLSGQGNSDYRRALQQRASNIQRTEMHITPGEAIVFRARNKAGLVELGAIGRIAALVNTSEHTAELNADQALSLVNQPVGNDGIPMFNAWKQAAGRKITGNPKLAAFDVAVETLTNEYAKVMSGGSAGTAISDAKQAQARHLLSTAQTPEAFKAAVAQMKIDMANRRAGIEAGRQDVYTRLKNNQDVPPGMVDNVVNGGSAAPAADGGFEYARSKSTGKVYKRQKGTTQWQAM